MTDVQDKWGLTSGLPLADADVEITTFEFGFNANIGAGLVCANIGFTITDNDELVDQSFTVGDGWEIGGKGASISGKKKINNQTNWGRLVQSMISACGGPEGIQSTLPDADYREAAGWIGTRWHLDTVDVEVYNPSNKTTKTASKIIATSFIGKGDASTNGATKPAAKKSGKPALIDTDPALFAELLAIAETHADHEDFVGAVLERADVESNPVAVGAVMSTKAGSVWAAKA